jgi:hypothetical protein
MWIAADQGTGAGERTGVACRVVEIHERTALDPPAEYQNTASGTGSPVAVRKAQRRPERELHKQLSRNPATRDAIRRELDAAVSLSSRLVAAAVSGDLMELSNIGFQLEDHLRQLWSLRGSRENDWGDLLNLLQTALALEEFERFSESHCRAIHKTIADYLAMGAVDADDITRAVIMLRESGLDPWKAISGVDSSEAEDDE